MAAVVASNTMFALSIKQPWAALVVAGLKTIEVRRWPTARRGRILIHAGRVPDDRSEAWDRVPDDVKKLAQLKGGVLGSVELTGCRQYANLATFLADQELHFNEASWFEPAGLYGFTFANPELESFRRLPGWFRFFAVEIPS